MKKQSIWLVVGLITILVFLIVILNFLRPDETLDTQSTAAAAAMTETAISVMPAAETGVPETSTPEINPTATTRVDPTATEAPAQAASRAYVAVEPADGSLILSPITFTAPITGLDALLQTGLDIVTQETSFGTAVCSIEGVGCPADNCFCSATNFWNYLNWDWAQNQFR